MREISVGQFGSVRVSVEIMVCTQLKVFMLFSMCIQCGGLLGSGLRWCWCFSDMVLMRWYGAVLWVESYYLVTTLEQCNSRLCRIWSGSTLYMCAHVRIVSLLTKHCPIAPSLLTPDPPTTTEGIREFGSDRADALSLNSFGAQSESMQPPVCAELWELLIIFLTPWQQES